MTPEALVALAALLLELRDFLRETDPGNLDAELVDSTVDVCVRLRKALVAGGAS